MLTHVIESWVSVYANHAALRTGVEFLHIAGLVVGGGCAITADVATIEAVRKAGASQTFPLQLLKKTHRLVILGLVALAVSGLLLLGADLETFIFSKVFWLKMGLMAALLMNGALLLYCQRQVARGEANAWPRLHHTAIASLVLWSLTTLAGACPPQILHPSVDWAPAGVLSGKSR